MRFVFVDYIPNSTTPARVYRSTGVVLINRSRFNHLPDFTKKFILKHEEGHYRLNTNDEFKADEYASDSLLLSEPGSLKNSIKALDEVLPMTSIEQKMRVREQVKRALRADAALGNNESLEALKNLIDMENNYEGTLLNGVENYGFNRFDSRFYNKFYDISSSETKDPNAFLNRTRLQALGFEKEVPETFIQTIGQTDNRFQVYESGKTSQTNVKNDVAPSINPETVLETENMKVSLSEDTENSETNIQVKVSNPLFYFMLGVITVLLLALIVNLFKD